MKKLFFIILVTLLPFALQAQDDFSCQSHIDLKEQQKILSKVDYAYGKVSDLKANFVQESYFAGLERNEYSKGEMFFKKSGKMNWLYESPEKQRFVSDAKIVWFYQPGLNQVTITNFKESFSSDVPVSFLLGIGKLEENFKLAGACLSENGISLRLIPKNADQTMKEFMLIVDKLTYLPKAARLIELGGNETTIKLINIFSNQGVAEEEFAFNIPLGVDVIDRRDKPTQGSASVFKETMGRISETDLVTP